jgi:hypothetical protein
VGRGRPSYRPRREFVAEWTRSNTPLLYFHRDRPSRGYTEAEFNKMIRAYSHAEDTARLLDQRPSATADGITYAPGKKQGVITENGRQVIQTWQPAAIKPCDGSAMPWLRFVTYLLPNRAERFQAMRWTATMIARPDIRMKWGIIARSETQGVGKTTWADILAAQVGFDNVSMPSEQTIAEGKFNSFLARVRLVICNEFYSGHSFRTYNKMKTWITDHTVEVEMKYLPSHTVPAFAHFFLCSNELVPILIDQKDRRFFIPTLTERKLSRAYWRKFYEWLAMDGHGIIRRWAEQFVAKHGPVAIEEEAPPSAAKTAMIEKGQSDEMRLIRDLAEHWVELGRADPPKRILFALDDFRTWLWRQDCGGRKRLSGTSVQKALRNAGLHVWGREDGDRRVKLDGRAGRKLIVITNFVPGPNEEWPTLGKGRLTSFDAPM